MIYLGCFHMKDFKGLCSLNPGSFHSWFQVTFHPSKVQLLTVKIDLDLTQLLHTHQLILPIFIYIYIYILL